MSFAIGDVNLDGSVDILDATEISKFAISTAALSDVQMKLADFNRDGVVNVLDATEIQKTLIIS